LGPAQEVEVIRKEGPSVDPEEVRLDKGGQAGEEVVPVLIVEEDLPPLDSSADDVMEGTGGI
jgi:hypothetical protein